MGLHQALGDSQVAGQPPPPSSAVICGPSSPNIVPQCRESTRVYRTTVALHMFCDGHPFDTDKHICLIEREEMYKEIASLPESKCTRQSTGPSRQRTGAKVVPFTQFFEVGRTSPRPRVRYQSGWPNPRFQEEVPSPWPTSCKTWLDLPVVLSPHQICAIVWSFGTYDEARREMFDLFCVEARILNQRTRVYDPIQSNATPVFQWE